MQIPLQQTKKWQKLQQDLGENTFFEENSDYTYLAIEKHTKIGNYLYLPYGPYLRTKNAARKAYNSLESLAKEKSAIFIRIEPQDAKNAEFLLNMPNCRKSTDLNPKETWALNLTPEKSKILSGFSQGTRTRYNQFSKKGLSVLVSKNPTDIHFLVDLQHQLARQKKIGTFSEKYLKTELLQDFATLYLVHYLPPEKTLTNYQFDNSNKPSGYSDKKIIAASLFFDHADTRFYMQSAADLNYKKLPATVALLSTAIFDAKEKGLKTFDFWGIAPENAPKNHPWAGFTAFKKSFGGYEIDYAGTHDIILDKSKYRLYQLLRKANRLRRKLKK